jgi:hypothetical protein
MPRSVLAGLLVADQEPVQRSCDEAVDGHRGAQRGDLLVGLGLVEQITDTGSWAAAV